MMSIGWAVSRFSFSVAASQVQEFTSRGQADAEEHEDESRWADAFARTPNLLAKLADEARAERRASRTKLLDPDML
jgi:hypothetical protein